MSRNVVGFLLKVGSQYVCWDQFKAGWFLGPRRQSEIFPFPRLFEPTSPRLVEVYALFPSAVVRYEKESHV